MVPASPLSIPGRERDPGQSCHRGSGWVLRCLRVPGAGSAEPGGYEGTPGWAEPVAASSFCIPEWEGVQAGSAAVALAGCRDVPMSLGPGARSLKD